MAEVYINTVDELNQLIESEKENLKAEVVKLREDIKHLQSKNSDLMVKGYRIQYERDALQARIAEAPGGLAVVYDNDVLMAIENCNQSYLKIMFRRAQGNGFFWKDYKKKGYEILPVLILRDDKARECEV